MFVICLGSLGLGGFGAISGQKRSAYAREHSHGSVN